MPGTRVGMTSGVVKGNAPNVRQVALFLVGEYRKLPLARMSKCLVVVSLE